MLIAFLVFVYFLSGYHRKSSELNEKSSVSLFTDTGKPIYGVLLESSSAVLTVCALFHRSTELSIYQQEVLLRGFETPGRTSSSACETGLLLQSRGWT